MSVELGKIESAYFGFGGYQDAQIGITISLSGKGWGTTTGKWMWYRNPAENAQWTVEGQDKEYAEIVRYVVNLLRKANIQKVSELKNTPVEAVFANNQLESWRILTEVL